MYETEMGQSDGHRLHQLRLNLHQRNAAPHRIERKFSLTHSCKLCVAALLLLASLLSHAAPRASGVGIILGDTDDRNFSDNKAVGRMILTYSNTEQYVCTGWLQAAGVVISAAHCFEDQSDGSKYVSGTLQFNVPASSANGERQDPPAANQYNIGTLLKGTSVIGEDYAVFKIDPNAGVSAFSAQGQFFRIAASIPVASSGTSSPYAALTGYGKDNSPAGSEGTTNAFNFTEQFSTGKLGPMTATTTTQTWVAYFGDSLGGASGGPYELLKTMISVGIHSGGGDPTINCGTGVTQCNVGTTFANPDISKAIDNLVIYPGTSYVYYADVGLPFWLTPASTATAPARAIEDAIAQFAGNDQSQDSSATINITAGYYNGAGITLAAPTGTSIVLVAAAGSVYIGPVLPPGY